MNLVSFNKSLLDKTICVYFFKKKKKKKKKMQRETGDKIQLGDTLNPLNVSAVPAIDNTSRCIWKN